MEWLRVRLISGRATCLTQIATKSLRFSSGFSANMDAFLVHLVPWNGLRSIIIFIEWSGLPVSALTFHPVLFSSLITDIFFLVQSKRITWNAWSGLERKVPRGTKSFSVVFPRGWSGEMGKLLDILFRLHPPPPTLQSDMSFFRTLDSDKLRNEYSNEVNIDLCGDAAKMGHLKILQYAVEDGCPWIPEKCLEAARKNKHEDVVQRITDGPH